MAAEPACSDGLPLKSPLKRFSSFCSLPLLILCLLDQAHCGVQGNVTADDGTPINATILVAGNRHGVHTHSDGAKHTLLQGCSRSSCALGCVGTFFRLLPPGEYVVGAYASGFYEQSVIVQINSSSFCDPRNPVTQHFVLQRVRISTHVLFGLVAVPAAVLVLLIIIGCWLYARYKEQHGKIEYEFERTDESDSETIHLRQAQVITQTFLFDDRVEFLL